MSSARSFLPALRARNYRLFISGQGVSLVGTWMQQVAVGWFLYRTTHSAFLLGAAGFAAQIPTFFLAPIAGVLADRWNRRRMLVATQALSLAQALVLSLLVMSQTARIWEILALSGFLGLVNAFDMPIRQAFVADLVDGRDALPSAIALNSSVVNAARLVGPSVAGLLIAAFGEGPCILVNALSYVPVIAALLAIRPRRAPPPASAAVSAGSLRDGLEYAFRSLPIRTLLLLLSLTSLLGLPYAVLLPIFAKDVLHGGAQTQGFLAAAAGVGALLGSFYLATRKGVLGLGRLIVLASAAFGVGLVALAVSRELWLTLAALGIVGFGMIVQWAAGTTIVQTILEEDKRGRVMSLFSAAFIGVSPIGSLLAGSVVRWVGAPSVVLFGGVACLAGSVWFAARLPCFRACIRPIYARMGLLPGSAGVH